MATIVGANVLKASFNRYRRTIGWLRTAIGSFAHIYTMGENTRSNEACIARDRAISGDTAALGDGGVQTIKIAGVNGTMIGIIAILRRRASGRGAFVVDTSRCAVAILDGFAATRDAHQ